MPLRWPRFIETRAPSAALAVLVLCGTSALLALAVGKDINWDLFNYHFYNGYALLTGRLDHDIAPAQLQTYLNPLLDVPLYLAIAHLSPVAVGMAYGFVQGLNAVAVWLIAKVLLPVARAPERGWAALGVALASIPSAGNLGELGGCMGDNLASIPLLFSVALLVRAHAKLEAASLRALLITSGVAGALAGVGAGLKLTVLLYAVCFCVGCLFLVRPLAGRLCVATGFGLGVLAGWLGMSGFWLWELWTRFENPLFPFFNGIFRSEWAPAELVLYDPFRPRSLLDALAYPVLWVVRPTLVGEHPFRDLRVSLAYVLAVILVVRAVVRRLRGVGTGFSVPAGPLPFLVACASLAYFAWLFMWGVYRYLVPIEWFAPLGIVLALFELVPRARVGAVAVAAFALATLGTKPLFYGRAGWDASYFGTKLPPFPAHEPGVVVVAGLEPLGFLVPSFPPELRFLRAETLNGMPDDRFDGLVRDAVRAHRGNFFVLFPGDTMTPAMTSELREFGLSPTPTECATVEIARPTPPPYAALRPGYVVRPPLPPIRLCSLHRDAS